MRCFTARIKLNSFSLQIIRRIAMQKVGSYLPLMIARTGLWSLEKKKMATLFWSSAGISSHVTQETWKLK